MSFSAPAGKGHFPGKGRRFSDHVIVVEGEEAEFAVDVLEPVNSGQHHLVQLVPRPAMGMHQVVPETVIRLEIQGKQSGRCPTRCERHHNLLGAVIGGTTRPLEGVSRPGPRQGTLAGVPLTPAERDVLRAIDEGTVLDDLATLVELPSTGGSPAEAEVQAWCAQRLAGLGADVDHWELDLAGLRAEDAYPGEEVERAVAFGCVGTWPGSGGETVPALVLAGHTDVVPPGDLSAWSSGPWSPRRDGAHVYGRGSCDMKGGLAAALAAASALRAAGPRLARPLAMHCVVAEEDGGLGAYATLRRGHRGTACVIAEPTAGTVVTANAGALTFRIEVRGRAAHGATRTRGVSALDAALPVLAALRELEAGRNVDAEPLLAHLDLPYPLSLGRLRAGDWASTVPDLLVAEGRYGTRPDEPVAAARRELEAAVAAACVRDPWLAEHPARVSWPGGVFAGGRCPEGHPLPGQVAAAAVDAGAPAPAVRGASYGSDLRLYAAAGIPTVQYGPGDVGVAHAADEYVAVEDVLRCARAYALLALRRCGQAA